MERWITIIALLAGVAGLFIESVNSFVTSEIAKTLLIPAFLIYFTYIFVTKGIEKYKHQNNKELEKEIFIREVTSKEKNEMLKGWTSLIMDKSLITNPNPQALTKKFENLYLKTAMYGGQRLVILVSLFQANNVKKAHLSKEYRTDKDNYKLLMYMAIIASEMKKEFTDVEMSPQTLIQIKFNDYNQKEKLLKDLEDEIEREYDEYLKNLKKIKKDDTQ